VCHACKLGLEGIVSKRKDSTYRSGRSPDWLKMKNADAPCGQASARSRPGSKRLSVGVMNSPKKEAPAGEELGGLIRPGAQLAERIKIRPLCSAVVGEVCCVLCFSPHHLQVDIA
jgi:hypothetical protein